MNLETFFAEKNLPSVSWEITGSDGEVNHISNDVVIEAVLQTEGVERRAIENALSRIDFENGDVNRFLRHLAEALVEQRINSQAVPT